MSKVLNLNAKWVDDCQGKKDYDGQIISISTRYWGSRNYEALGGVITKPSAKSDLMIHYLDEEGNESWIDLISVEFEADTENEVKGLVQEWAQGQMNKVVSILKEAYNFTK